MAKKPVTKLCKLCQTEASPVHVSEAKGKIFCTGTCIHPCLDLASWEWAIHQFKQDKIQVVSLHGSYPNYTKVRYWFETEELVVSNFSEATRLWFFLAYLSQV